MAIFTKIGYLAYRVAPYAEMVLWGVMLSLLLLLAGCAVTSKPAAERKVLVPIAITLSAEQIELLRHSCSGGSSVDLGKASISSTTYPCEILRTYAAIEATRGRGFWMGTFPRWMLKMRLVTKGIFSGIAGLVGLG